MTELFLAIVILKNIIKQHKLTMQVLTSNLSLLNRKSRWQWVSMYLTPKSWNCLKLVFHWERIVALSVSVSAGECKAGEQVPPGDHVWPLNRLLVLGVRLVPEPDRGRGMEDTALPVIIIIIIIIIITIIYCYLFFEDYIIKFYTYLQNGRQNNK